MRERGEGREFIFVSKLPFGVKSENKQQQQEHTERERESEHRERERVTNESSLFFLAMMTKPCDSRYEFMARGVRARALLITTANAVLCAEPKRKKTLRSLSLSLSCVFFFLPSLRVNNNTLEEKENARKSDRLL